LKFHPDYLERIRTLVLKHMPAALIVDEDMVESFAREQKKKAAGIVVPGTEFIEDPRAEIAKEL
jgi:hypothetical protein